MRNVNTLWCVVERALDGSGRHRVMTGEVFGSRQAAREYLSALKSGGVSRPRGLFIRQLRVSNRRS